MLLLSDNVEQLFFVCISFEHDMHVIKGLPFLPLRFQTLQSEHVLDFVCLVALGDILWIEGKL